MFDFNVTEIVQTFQSVNYYYVLSNLIGVTYLELLVFTIGMFFYAMFVWYFYQKLAKRDIFELNLEKYDQPGVKWRRIKKAGSSIAYVLKYWIIFPFYIIFWFAVLSLFLFLLAKNVSIRQITLTSMALVATVRIASYFNEELSHDLAKLLPLALLAIFLLDPTFFSWDLLLIRVKAITTLGWEILQLIIFGILLEWILRIFYSIKVAGSKRVYVEASQPENRT